jgi:hypothetical protein
MVALRARSNNNVMLAHVTPTTLSRHSFRDAAVYTRLPQDSAGCPPAVSIVGVVLCIAYPTPGASGTCPRDCAMVHSLGWSGARIGTRKLVQDERPSTVAPSQCFPQDERMPWSRVSVPRRWDGTVRVPDSQRSLTSSPGEVPGAAGLRTRSWTYRKGGTPWILSIRRS